jgi:hypothetical protein
MTSDNATLLLPDVMSKVAGLGPSALAAVHQFLLKLELAQLTEDIQDEADVLRLSGELEPELIDAAIREHRRNQPYAS